MVHLRSASQSESVDSDGDRRLGLCGQQFEAGGSTIAGNRERLWGTARMATPRRQQRTEMTMNATDWDSLPDRRSEEMQAAEGDAASPGETHQDADCRKCDPARGGGGIASVRDKF